MNKQFKRCMTVSIFYCSLMIASRNAEAGEISLNLAGVVVDADEASYVHYTISELRRQIELLTGYAPVLFHDLEEAMGTHEVEKLGLKIPVGSLVMVGRAMANRLAQTHDEVKKVTDQYPGEQGFVLKSMEAAGGRNMVLATGSDSHGSNYALMELRQLLTESTSGLGVTDDLDLLDKPNMKVRGMFIHQHWKYNYPYCPWSWSADEWKRVIDTLAYMRYNLLMPFSHTDNIAPRGNPTNAEKEYLADLREIIDYAHRRRGMKVWLMESGNILLDSPEYTLLSAERRDHYTGDWGWPGKREDPRSPSMKDPSNPEDFAAMMAQRESVIRHVPNADGYGCIDSDPGRKIPWCTTTEFVDLFVGYRELIERYHERPDEVTQFIWLNWGWGTEKQEEDNWRNVMSDWVKRVEGPRDFQLWMWNKQAPIAQELGELPQTSLMTHAVTGGGCDLGFTSIHFDGIRGVFDSAADYPGVDSITANALTYLVEFPNIFFFGQYAAWSSKNKNADNLTILQDAARHFFPEQAELLAQSWAQLIEPGSEAAFTAAERIEELLENNQTGRTGTIGSFVFPEPTQVFQDLVRMLRIHAKAETVRERVDRKEPINEVREAVVSYLDDMLQWQKIVGFYGAYGPDKQVSWELFAAIQSSDPKTVIAAWEQTMQKRDDREKLQRGIVKELCERGYTHWIVFSLVGQHLWGYRTQGFGGFLPSNKFDEKKYIDAMPDSGKVGLEKRAAQDRYDWYRRVFGETTP
jgi:hypothetical protein